MRVGILCRAECEDWNDGEVLRVAKLAKSCVVKMRYRIVPVRARRADTRTKILCGTWMKTTSDIRLFANSK